MEEKNSADHQDPVKKWANQEDPAKPSVENPEKQYRSKTDPLNMNRPPLKEHSNPMIRGFARTGYTIWIIVLAVGLFLAFVVSLFLV